MHYLNHFLCFIPIVWLWQTTKRWLLSFVAMHLLCYGCMLLVNIFMPVGVGERDGMWIELSNCCFVVQTHNTFLIRQLCVVLSLSLFPVTNVWLCMHLRTHTHTHSQEVKHRRQHIHSLAIWVLHFFFFGSNNLYWGICCD